MSPGLSLGMFAVSVALGLLTGWLAGSVLKDGGYGPISDLVLGLMGSSALTTIVAAVGTPAEVGSVAMAGVAILGAVVVIVSQRKIWPALT